MEIWTKRLALSLDTRLMFLPGLSVNSRRHFPLQCCLPELLFNEGFQAYKSFCMQAHSSYSNTVTDSASEASNVILFESEELVVGSIDDSDDDAINMLFMLHKNIILKYGKGITREVAYLGPQFSDKILQHKV